jgi:hypothetical protein
MAHDGGCVLAVRRRLDSVILFNPAPLLLFLINKPFAKTCCSIINKLCEEIMKSVRVGYATWDFGLFLPYRQIPEHAVNEHQNPCQDEVEIKGSQ